MPWKPTWYDMRAFSSFSHNSKFTCCRRVEKKNTENNVKNPIKTLGVQLRFTTVAPPCTITKFIGHCYAFICIFYADFLRSTPDADAHKCTNHDHWLSLDSAFSIFPPSTAIYPFNRHIAMPWSHTTAWPWITAQIPMWSNSFTAFLADRK